MLLSLTLKNYALIDDLRLEFLKGLNIFTGETGAGKSIIVESIKLLLGERASADLVGKGAKNCFIYAEFDCSENKPLKNFMKNLALDLDDGMLYLRREIDVSGKSRAFINDVPVSIKTLSSIGDYLVDVHGQHEHQSLFSSAAQRKFLDNFAGTEKLINEVSSAFEIWKKLLSRKQAQSISEQEKQRLIDIYGFQVKEIENASLLTGEDEEIELKLPQLKNADKLKGFAEEAYAKLYESEGSIIEQIGKVQKLVDNINSLGGQLNIVSDNLVEISSRFEDSAKDIENYKEKLDCDPDALEKLLERQDLIKNLKKKYGSSTEEILEFHERISKELEALLKIDENRLELEKEIKKAEENLFGLCEKLSKERKKAAEKLSGNIEKELNLLGMKKARFSVSIEKMPEPAAEGWDKIEFMFQVNPGEDLKPLKDIASGGESSRVMLAVKTVLAKADNLPVLIFDEIDTGIGGAIGQIVGRKLNDLSNNHQIICVTHLAQIAAFARQNISVVKETSSNKTRISAKTLSEKDKLEEIARMLSGEVITSSARKHAEELISDTRI